MNHENGRDAYYTMSLTDGSISEPLFVRDDADIESVISDIQRIVYGVRYSGFKPSYGFFNKKIDKTFKAIQKEMPNNTFSIVDYTPDWQSILLYMEGADTSGDYFLFQNGGFKFITSARPEIPGTAVNSVLETSYKARDELVIPTLVTYPKGIEHKNLPTIILPHGGPESYDRNNFDWLTQYFANRGYLVIQPQFRGSDGFGLKHLLAGRGEWGQKMQNDLTDAVDHFANVGTVNRERVCIVGASYGGYAALAGAVFTPDVYQCVISINGVADIENMMSDDKRQYGSDHWVVSYWEEVIKKNNLSNDFLDKISPINFVKNVKVPILLIHGEIDKVVSIEQSEDIYDELMDENKDVTFIELEDEGHHLINNKTRLQTLEAIDAFIGKHL
jgi:dipeptidyl aminopeptidase/acylaminoacyl peptidase